MSATETTASGGVGRFAARRRLGIALSGGGHRATAWGIGVLAAVVDDGLAADTVSISSVSGGSIANAAVAVGGDFVQLDDAAELASWVAPTLRVVASTGLFLPGTPTRRYVSATLGAMAVWAGAAIALVTALGAVARGQPLWPYTMVGAALGALCGFALSRFLGRGRVMVDIAGAVLGAAVASGTAAAVRHLALAGGIVAIVLLLLITGISCGLSLYALSQRGEAVRRALAVQLSRDGADLLLRDIHHQVNHVFCTTDLEFGNCLFFTPRIVYGHLRGVADTRASELTVAQITQASAAVPPGFAPVTVHVPPFDPPHDGGQATHGAVTVSDGGVYDNLGDEWETSFERRTRHHRQLLSLQEPADVLLVSDASPSFGRQPFSARADALAGSSSASCATST